MREGNRKGALLKSEYRPMDEGGAEYGEDQDKTHGIISHKCKYTGSEFHMTVQHYLAQNIDLRVHFKDKHRSKYNQQSIKEVKVGIIGSGQTFGDIDAYRQRGYMYTLRTASSNCVFYECDARDFVTHIKSINKEREFKRW